MSRESIPGVGCVKGMFLRADGTRVFTTSTTLLQLPPSGMPATIAGDKDVKDESPEDGQGPDACFSNVSDFKVDRGSTIVPADTDNHARPATGRQVTRTVGATPRFKCPAGVVLTRRANARCWAVGNTRSGC